MQVVCCDRARGSMFSSSLWSIQQQTRAERSVIVTLCHLYAHKGCYLEHLSASAPANRNKTIRSCWCRDQDILLGFNAWRVHQMLHQLFSGVSKTQKKTHTRLKAFYLIVCHIMQQHSYSRCFAGFGLRRLRQPVALWERLGATPLIPILISF